MEIDWTLVSSVLSALGLGVGGTWLGNRTPKQVLEGIAEYKRKIDENTESIRVIRDELRFEVEVEREVTRRLNELNREGVGGGLPGGRSTSSFVAPGEVASDRGYPGRSHPRGVLPSRTVD